MEGKAVENRILPPPPKLLSDFGGHAFQMVQLQDGGWLPTQLQTLSKQATNFCQVKPLRFQSAVVNYPDQRQE